MLSPKSGTQSFQVPEPPRRATCLPTATANRKVCGPTAGGTEGSLGPPHRPEQGRTLPPTASPPFRNLRSHTWRTQCPVFGSGRHDQGTVRDGRGRMVASISWVGSYFPLRPCRWQTASREESEMTTACQGMNTSRGGGHVIFWGFLTSLLPREGRWWALVSWTWRRK